MAFLFRPVIPGAAPGKGLTKSFCRRNNGRKDLAFTVVELLVALALVSIVSLFALSANNRMKASVHNVGCVSNLRQYGMAFHLFAADHEGKLPLGDSNNLWFDQLRPYLNALARTDEMRLRCPGFSQVIKEYYPDPNDSTPVKRRGYQYNRNLESVVVARLARPSLTPLLWDTTGTSKDASGFPGGGSFVHRKYRHRKEMNLLMVSGEVVSRAGNYVPDEKVDDTDLPVERNGINWAKDGEPFYWAR